MIIEVIFWILTGILAWSFLGYPLMINLLGSITGKKYSIFTEDYFPSLSVVMSCHNEEQLVETKIEALLDCDYPADKLEIIAGSDGSTDNTDKILNILRKKHSSIKFIKEKRRGKSGMINKLVNEAKGEIVIVTDTDVMPGKDSLRTIVAPFINPEIGLVDARISISPPEDSNHVNINEKAYHSMETRLKLSESRYRGCMIGPSGGFYAFRRELFREIPENFLVDDFFICMNILKKGYRAVMNKNAGACMTIPTDFNDEFKRKTRISAGNFQNMAWFMSSLFTPWRMLTFRYISHKVIRWKAPFLYIPLLVLNAFLTEVSQLYQLLFLVQLILILLPLIDMVCYKLGIRISPLRFISYFYLMNVAMLIGFLRYVKGIRSGIWEPTKRD